MKTTMKGLLIWFAMLAVLLSLFGLWAGAQERRAARSVDPSVYTDTMEPELPAIGESQPEAADTGSALTF